MAYVDHELQFSRRQELTETAASTNVVDLGYAPGDVGTGTTLYVVVTAPVALDDGTLKVALQESDAENFASPRTVVESATVSELGDGVAIIMPIPPHAGRYLRLNYTVTGGGASATVDAGIQMDVQRWRAYEATPDE